jgi:D-sedoheptulose 7-phosphate isomerase
VAPRQRLRAEDGVFVLSVGGGNLEKKHQSQSGARAGVRRERGATIVGIVGRDGGYTGKGGTACVIVPTVNPTPSRHIPRRFQAVVWHPAVSHPALKAAPTKWESTR